LQIFLRFLMGQIQNIIEIYLYFSEVQSKRTVTKWTFNSQLHSNIPEPTAERNVFFALLVLSIDNVTFYSNIFKLLCVLL